MRCVSHDIAVDIYIYYNKTIISINLLVVEFGDLFTKLSLISIVLSVSLTYEIRLSQHPISCLLSSAQTTANCAKLLWHSARYQT